MTNFEIFDRLLKPTDNNLQDIASQSSEDIMNLVREYTRLSFNCKSQRSQEEEERLDNILAIAEETPLLEFWLSEVDHILAHKQGFLDEDARESYKDQHAFLHDYINVPSFPCPKPITQPLVGSNSKK